MAFKAINPSESTWPTVYHSAGPTTQPPQDANLGDTTEARSKQMFFGPKWEGDIECTVLSLQIEGRGLLKGECALGEVRGGCCNTRVGECGSTLSRQKGGRRAGMCPFSRCEHPHLWARGHGNERGHGLLDRLTEARWHGLINREERSISEIPSRRARR